MGINNLNKLLRDAAPTIFEEVHLSHYAFKRVAIDISLYLHKFKAACTRCKECEVHSRQKCSMCVDRWLVAFINLVSSLRRNEVHCVFIFDGKAPPEKEAEQARRKAERAKLEEHVYFLEDALTTYHQTGVVEKCLSELYNRRRSPKRLLGPVKKDIDMNWVENKVQQKRNQLYNISSVDFDLVKDLLHVLNVPFYTAPFEAEKTCSKLCIDGKVDAVLSEDTDVIAYGAPVFLTKINTNNDTCVRVTNEKVLAELELEKETLLDLCIMCGTDYNMNIPRIGSKTAYKYIVTHGRIEEIAKITGLDIKILNHIRVRELFTEFEDCEIENIPYCGRPDFEVLHRFVVMHEIQVNIDKLRSDFIRDIVIGESDDDVEDVLVSTP